MKNFVKNIYIAIFMIISLVPLGLFLLGYGKVSDGEANIEKKANLVMPQIVTDKGINDSFGDEFEEWINQNIPYRGQLLSNINIVLGEEMKNPTSNVVIGKDGWIFSEETTDNYLDTNALSDDDIRNIGITLSIIEKRIEELGGKFLFVAVPNKNTIYSEYMPDRFIKSSENNLTRIYKELSLRKVNYTDLKASLLNAKQDNSLKRLYYKRDTHWTSIGAIIGYENIMEGLDRTPTSYDLTNVESSYTRRSDLDKLLYPSIERFDEEYFVEDNLDYDSFEFTFPTGVTDNKAQLDNFMSDAEDHDNNFTIKKKVTLNEKSLYMVRDSFARALLPYMIDMYDNATFVRSVTPSFENIGDCGDVVYEICERNIKNVIASAPFVYAPEGVISDARFLHSSNDNTCYIDDEGYAYRVYGTVDRDMVAQDGRIYIYLQDEETQGRAFEAFPIYEEQLMSDKEVVNRSDISGYSLYIDKKMLDKEEYSVRIVSGDNESDEVASILVDEDSSADVEEEETYVNPYEAENADHQIVYRGVSIGIGDNIYSLKGKLGDQAAPAQIITSCLSGTDAAMYYYPDITLETDMDGVIYYISLMDNSYGDGSSAATAKGIAIGTNKMDIWDKLGDPYKENDKNCTYRTEHLKVTYSYKSGLVTSVILEDRKYIAEEEAVQDDTLPGVEYESGNTYLYDEGHHMQTGWQIIDGQYYFFDRLTGERVVGKTVDGIDIGPDGEVNLSSYEKDKIETMMKANKIVMENTNPSDTMEEKRRKVFDWVLSFPYHQYRLIKDCYTQEGIEIIEANDIFEEGAGDCVSESAALAFLFHEIGYENVYWVHDTGHSWVRSDDRLFDPLFAEARDFEANYDAPFKDYRKMMNYSMLIY